MVNVGADRVSGRRGGQNIGDQTLLSAFDPVVIFLFGRRVTMPEQDIGAFRVPVYLSPEIIDGSAKRHLLRVIRSLQRKCKIDGNSAIAGCNLSAAASSF